jgi:hypothetical protein
MAMRRSRPAQHPPTGEGDDNAEDSVNEVPLDEEEQQTIIDELQSHMAANHRQLRTIFRAVCYVASFLCLAAPALLVQHLQFMDQHHPTPDPSHRPQQQQQPFEYEQFLSRLWLHAFIAALLHSCTPFAIIIVNHDQMPLLLATAAATKQQKEQQERQQQQQQQQIQQRQQQQQHGLSSRSRFYATGLIMSLFLAAMCNGNIRSQSQRMTTAAGADSETTTTWLLLRLHQGLAMGNIVLALVALYLNHDMNQAVQEVQNLQQVKYRYKSL